MTAEGDTAPNKPWREARDRRRRPWPYPRPRMRSRPGSPADLAGALGSHLLQGADNGPLRVGKTPFLVSAVAFAGMSFFPQFNQTSPRHGYGFGVSITEASYMMLPHLCAATLVGLGAAWVLAHVGIRQVLLLGCLLVTTAMLAVSMAHDHKWQMYVWSGILGAGAGLVFAYLNNVIIDVAPAEIVSVASATNFNLKTLGAAVGSTLMSVVVSASAGADSVPTAGGYVGGFLFFALVAVIAAATTWGLRSQPL